MNDSISVNPSLTVDAHEGGLSGAENFWVENYQWLRNRGYQLRLRYSPGWIPSWIGTKKNFRKCEDGVTLRYAQICDATHIPTGALVALKIVQKSFNPREAEIVQHLSSDPLSMDPRNHCAQLLEVLDLPDHIMGQGTQILVMPLLRPFNSPKFDTVGEAVECFRQLFEGLQFLHEQHIAHRDLNINNFMMEWTNMFPDRFHPQDNLRSRDMGGKAPFFTRTQQPTRYVMIDFGLSSRYHPNTVSPREQCIFGGDNTVPEFLERKSYHDPYKADVYCAGNLIRTEFIRGHPFITDIRGHKSFEFMKPLIDDMVQDDPTKRPSMNEVVKRFEEIIQRLSQRKLRSWSAPRMLYFSQKIQTPFYIVLHWKRKLVYIMNKTPAIPTIA